MSLTVARWKLYVAEELRLGGHDGPTPHLTIAARFAEAQFVSPYERAWFIGCWAGPYVATTGYQVWRRFPTKDFDGVEMLDFLREHWKHLPVRGSERRGVMSPAKLTAFYQSYASWLLAVDLYGATYDQLWASAAANLRYAGRFTIIKLLEALRLAGATEAGLSHGIQPIGGWSPRRALDEIAHSAGYESDLEHGNTREKIDEVNRAAAWAGSLIEGEALRPWLVEALLCGGRQVQSGKYPGRAHDTDLAYALRSREYWKDDDAWFWHWRDLLFPEDVLGEQQGWSGVREPEIERWIAT